MNTVELIGGYKFKHTPLADSDSILSYYRRNIRETVSDIDDRFFAIDIDCEPVIHNRFIASSTILKTILENKSRKYIKLYSDFQTKWVIKKEFFSDFQESFVFEKIKYTLNSILNFNPSYVTFDLTEDSSAFFQAMVNGKNIYFELFFTNDVDGSVEAVSNIYENSKCIFAYGGSIEETFSKINFQIAKKTWSFEPTEYQYELSESSLATATF